jgi:hypothetical protein
MLSFNLSRQSKYPTKAVRPAARRRPRLEVEALEERMVLNTYSVVSGAADGVTTFSTLNSLLSAAGVHSGDVIQIEPGSNPGHISNTDIPALKNLTIQGDPGADLSSIPYFFLDTPVFIGPAQQGFTLKHVQFDITNGTLQFNADGTITDSHVKEDFAGNAIELQGTSAAVIRDSYFESDNPQSQANSLLTVSPAINSHDLITDNQFVAVTGKNITLLTYNGSPSGSDVVAHNTFIGNTGEAPLLDVKNFTQGLTIQSNTFTDSSSGGLAIKLEPPVQNLQIVDNVMSFPNGNGTGILVDTGSGGASSSMIIADNHMNVGSNGAGIVFRGEALGLTLNAKVEGNDFRNSFQGILMQTGAGGSMAGVDLGGGALGSRGGNDFRGDHFALYVFTTAAEGPIQAQMDIFGVDPTTVIHDHNVDPTLAAVVTTNALTGNAAYVQTLYVDFLHRAGDVNSSSDAGHWVTLLGQGTSASTVATQIVRSAEALGVAVDGLYHRFLGRNADPAGRAGFVSYLQTGGTLEGVSATMLAAPEYQSHFQTNSDFVQSLYQNLLQRTPDASEVNAYLTLLPQLGRAAVARGFLSSSEFRGDEAGSDYTQLLGRAPSAAEVNGWVGSNLDLLTIDTFFAASSEFQMNG